jgi:hypothetical protein
MLRRYSLSDISLKARAGTYMRLVLRRKKSIHDILNPCAALTHSLSSTLLTFLKILLPPMRAWKNSTLSSSPITRNVDIPKTETAPVSSGEAGELEDTEIGTSKGVLSEATMT